MTCKGEFVGSPLHFYVLLRASRDAHDKLTLVSILPAPYFSHIFRVTLSVLAQFPR